MNKLITNLDKFTDNLSTAEGTVLLVFLIGSSILNIALIVIIGIKLFL